MQKKNSIEKYSRTYYLLKKYIVFLTNQYYRISIANSENMKPGDHLIYASNHHNALMDALALHASLNTDPIFMARSDIFAKKTIAKILNLLKILPIYRIRDGYDQLANNQEVFKQTFSVLDQKSPLGIFPEGNHDGKKKLRTLKKGVARIAFSYRHESAEKKEIKIVPIGLNYTDYHTPGSGLLVRIGKAVSVSDFDAEYIDNPARATNDFIQKLELELKKNMLHVEEDEVYQTCEILLQSYASLAKGRGESHERIFTTQKEIIAWVEKTFNEQPEQYQRMNDLANELDGILTKKNLGLQSLSLLSAGSQKPKIFAHGLLLALSSPVYLYSFIQNLLPGLAMRKISTLIKDPQFESSVKLVGIAFIYPVFWLLQTIVFGLISGSLLLTSLYFLTLPITLLIRHHWEALWITIQHSQKLRSVSDSLSRLLKGINQLSGFRF
jgi:1-acyl-sn-glycerol-3-phosphate acyltransferase